MGKIKVHAGDFVNGGHHSFGFGVFHLYTPDHPFKGEAIIGTELESADIATEESVKKIGGTVGWGVAGAALLGPAGLLAGLLLGGKKKEVTFIARFKDGRKMLATTDSKTFTKIQASVF